MLILFALVGLLPSLVWLAFYLKEDLHPEPKRLLIYTFTLGVTFAFIALIVQTAIKSQFTVFGIPALGFTSLLIFAAIEEFAKFFAAYFAVHNSPEFDEPVDAMIYMVTAAMGFATLENVGAALGGDIGFLSLGGAVEVSLLRFVGATLLHALTSAIVGYAWAWNVREFNVPHFLIAGLLGAIGLHTFFNFLIVTLGTITYPVLLLTIVGFFVLFDFEKLKAKAV